MRNEIECKRVSGVSGHLYKGQWSHLYPQLNIISNEIDFFLPKLINELKLTYMRRSFGYTTWFGLCNECKISEMINYRAARLKSMMYLQC